MKTKQKPDNFCVALVINEWKTKEKQFDCDSNCNLI